MAVERSELQLLWPAELFAGEARALLDAGADDDTLGGLLAEAVHGDRGEKLLEQVARDDPAPTGWDDPWALGPTTSTPASQPTIDPGRSAGARLVAELALDAHQLPRHRLRPLLSKRRRAPADSPRLTLAEVTVAFGNAVAQLAALGYFEDAFGSTCPDSRDAPADAGQRHLQDRLGDGGWTLWPLGVHYRPDDSPYLDRPEHDWPEEVLLDLIEALDEVVARPRTRSWHRFHDGWDYSNYSRSAGQAVYRWRVNKLLDRSEVPLRLAEAGSDAGLLVHSAGDARDELVDRVLVETGPGGNRDDVAHAVQLFRSRAGTREAKRSAIVTLAGVLEHRRRLLKTELLSKDEGPLFLIANEFDLRHRNPCQQRDYEDVFLDWVFWWYLGTVELTDRLLDRQAGRDG